MKETEFTMTGDPCGTSLRGYIETSYYDLVGCFGPPNGFESDKVDARWVITFADGVIATIYNYKNGKNYCGKVGLDVKDITNWHIGGFPETDVATRVEEVMLSYLERICYKVPTPLPDNTKSV